MALSRHRLCHLVLLPTHANHNSGFACQPVEGCSHKNVPAQQHNLQRGKLQLVTNCTDIARPFIFSISCYSCQIARLHCTNRHGSLPVLVSASGICVLLLQQPFRHHEHNVQTFINVDLAPFQSISTLFPVIICTWKILLEH